MNKRQRKKHSLFWGYENALVFKRYFDTHKSKRKYSARYLREIYKAGDYTLDLDD